MADKPILFSAPMVRGLIREVEKPGAGKTQTRRMLKPQPHADATSVAFEEGEWFSVTRFGEYYLPVRFAKGDRLWVRETFATDGVVVRYAATDDIHELRRKKPGIHMPRWASRLTLTVTDVRVQRLQEISEEDARSEGAHQTDTGRFVILGSDGMAAAPMETARDTFRHLWQDINGEESWCANPFVSALTFSVERRNIDLLSREKEDGRASPRKAGAE